MGSELVKPDHLDRKAVVYARPLKLHRLHVALDSGVQPIQHEIRGI